MKKIIVAISALALFAPAIPFAHAGDVPPAAISACAITKDAVASVTAPKDDPKLGYLDAIKAELALRKDLLHQTVICAEKETQELKGRLDSFSPSDKNAQTVAARLSGALGDAVRYYGAEDAKIDTLGLSGSERFANDLKTWRANTYLPLASQTSKFILWLSNQSLIDAAQNRLNQIGLTIKVLKIIDNDEISNLYAKAQSDLASAADYHAQAFQIFNDPNSTDDPLPLMKSTLQSLSDAYNNFLDASNQVQKILPH